MLQLEVHAIMKTRDFAEGPTNLNPLTKKNKQYIVWANTKNGTEFCDFSFSTPLSFREGSFESSSCRRRDRKAVFPMKLMLHLTTKNNYYQQERMIV